MSAASTPSKEYYLCVLGCEAVGKTSLAQRLTGVPFNRKTGHKPSVGEEAVQYSVEASTSAGVVLLHLVDWAWETKRREQSINQQLMRGRDGAVFVYDITDKQTKTDFPDYVDWYQRAAGFDKPWLIISNKNDQKKRAVQDNEGVALARQADGRAYVAVSLVDDSGLDDAVLALCRIMLKDLNVTLSGFRKASDESMAWSAARASVAADNLGLGLAAVKQKRVLLWVANKSVREKFFENLQGSEYAAEEVGSLDDCTELLEAGSGATGAGECSLPITAIVVPPTASEQQQKTLKEFATAHKLGLVVVVPRAAVDRLRAEAL